MARLEAIEVLGPLCELLPADECRAVIDASENLKSTTPALQATDMAQAILGVYRKDDVNDPQVYVRALAGLLSSFPFAVTRKVAHPYEGLPSRLKFLPSIAEVREALESEALRQRNLVNRAKWMLQERERREAEKAERRALTMGDELKLERVNEIIRKVFGDKTI